MYDWISSLDFSQNTNYFNCNLNHAITDMLSETPTIINTETNKITKEQRMESFKNQQFPDIELNIELMPVANHLPVTKNKKKPQKNITEDKPKTTFFTPVAAKEQMLSWKILDKKLRETEEIIPLWNCKNQIFRYKKDVVILDEEKLEKKIKKKDNFTQEKIRNIARDGHASRPVNAQGYIKTGDSYKLKVLGILGDDRFDLKRTELTAIDNNNIKYSVHEFELFKPKAHK